MDFYFKEMSLEQIQHVIYEADMSHAFLPQKDEPSFKVYDLFKHFINNIDFHVFAFVEGTEVTGFISVLPAKEEYELSIGPMFISQRYQSLGLGKRQVEEVLEWARNNNVRKLHTKTWGQNSRSRRIFQKLGFAFVAEVPTQRINGDSTVKFVYVILES